MLVDRRGKLALEALQLLERAIAARLQFADDRLDLRPAALPFLDDPPLGPSTTAPVG